MWIRRCGTSLVACPHRRGLEPSTTVSDIVRIPLVAVLCSAVKSFFRMTRSEAAVLVFLILFSLVSFLPVWRTIEIAGMVVFGWMMAALMVISPALALLVFLGSRRQR